MKKRAILILAATLAGCSGGGGSGGGDAPSGIGGAYPFEATAEFQGFLPGCEGGALSTGDALTLTLTGDAASALDEAGACRAVFSGLATAENETAGGSALGDFSLEMALAGDCADAGGAGAANADFSMDFTATGADFDLECHGERSAFDALSAGDPMPIAFLCDNFGGCPGGMDGELTADFDVAAVVRLLAD